MMPVGLIAPARPVIPLKTIITSLSLPTPDLVLDAGDPASFSSPTAETWVDVQNGNNFYVGTTGGVDANQPTFEGAIGDFTAAFGLSSAVVGFQEASALTFAEPWHKDNAAFTAAGLVYLPSASTGATRGVFLFASSDGATSSRGVLFALQNNNTSRILGLSVGRGTSPLALSLSIDVAAYANVNAWNFVAVALNEATGTNGATFFVNGQSVQATSTYSSPSASDSTLPYTIAAAVSGTVGAKMKMFAGWSSRLTTTQLGDLYTRVRQDRQFDLP